MFPAGFLRLWRDIAFASVFTLLVGLVAMLPPSNALANGCSLAGAGTAETPYLVSEPSHLGQITTCGVDKHYRQTAHLDLVGTHTPIGTVGAPFSGTYDGDNWEIRNLQVNVTDYAGLFGVVGTLELEGQGGTVRNVSITSGGVTSVNGPAGGVVGLHDAGLITGSVAAVTVSVTATPGDSNVGGFVGSNQSTIRDSSASGNVSGHTNVGGFVGRNDEIIEASSASGRVEGAGAQVGGFVGFNLDTIGLSRATGAVDGNDEVGGFVGENEGTITRSSASGIVTGTATEVGGFVGFNDDDAVIRFSSASGSASGNDEVGGFVGENNNGATISGSRATGDATGALSEVGGFAGLNDNSSISNSYALGDATGGSEVGGFIGDDSGTIFNSYSLGTPSGSSAVGGFSGKAGTITNSFWDLDTSGLATSFGGTGKTTSEMNSISTFNNVETAGLEESWPIVAGWAQFDPDGATLWGICAGVGAGYPFLLWEYDTNPCPTVSQAEGALPSEEERRAPRPGIHLDLQVSVGDMVREGSVVIGGEGLASRSDYLLEVRSTPQVLASGKTTSFGNFSERVSLPTLAPGLHTLTLTAIAPDGSTLSLVQTFTVGAGGTVTALGTPVGSQGNVLAATGVQGLDLSLGFAGAAALFGVALVFAARRRQASP